MWEFLICLLIPMQLLYIMWWKTIRSMKSASLVPQYAEAVKQWNKNLYLCILSTVFCIFPNKTSPHGAFPLKKESLQTRVLCLHSPKALWTRCYGSNFQVKDRLINYDSVLTKNFESSTLDESYLYVMCNIHPYI